MSAARRRVARALRTLRTRLGDLDVELDVVDELEDLGRWLEEFHARSWVELDYAGLARLLGPEVVAEDTSVGRRGGRGGRARRRGRGGRGAHLPQPWWTAGRPSAALEHAN